MDNGPFKKRNTKQQSRLQQTVNNTIRNGTTLSQTENMQKCWWVDFLTIMDGITHPYACPLLADDLIPTIYSKSTPKIFTCPA
jgi:hypothetical protein